MISYNTHNPCYEVLKTFDFKLTNPSKCKITNHSRLFNDVKRIEKHFLTELKKRYEYKNDWIKMSKKEITDFINFLEENFNK